MYILVDKSVLWGRGPWLYCFFFVLLEIVATLLVDTRTETAIEFVGLVFFLLGNFFLFFEKLSLNVENDFESGLTAT